MTAVDFHSGIAADFDARYSHSAGFIERRRIWRRLIERYAHPRAHVLDAGCGSGVLSAVAAPLCRSVIAFDASAKMIDICKSKKKQMNLHNVDFTIGSLDDLSFIKSNQFDIIICSSVLEYIEDIDSVLSELTNLLSPYGVLLFSMPNGASLYRSIELLFYKCTGKPFYYRYVHHVLKLDDLVTRISRIGLEFLDVEYYAKTPVLSNLMHIIGKPVLSDNMMVISCSRAVDGCPAK